MPSAKQIWGALCEAIAEEALHAEGYEIIERNWRAIGGEIDRIAWHGRVLCFVEVRARSSFAFGSPAETIGWKKRKKLVQVASAYLSRFSAANTPLSRFDVVAVVDPGGGAHVSLIKNAFGEET